MGIACYISVLCVAAHPAVAQGLACSGSDPTWTLAGNGDAATFAFFDRVSDLRTLQESVAEGAEFPLARTLVGPRDSLILILEAPAGDGQPARILTQRGETPVLLVGRCGTAP